MSERVLASDLSSASRACRVVRTVVAMSFTVALLLVVSAASTAAQAPSADASTRSIEEIDRALLVVYVHGVTEEIALGEVGHAGVPRILEHLKDPDHPRRDNLVAFLYHLAGPAERDALLASFTDSRLSMMVPEEDRARLLVPQALGKLAERGDDRSLEILLEMTSEDTTNALLQQAAGGYIDPALGKIDLVESALIGLALSKRERAFDRLTDVGLGRYAPVPYGRDVSELALEWRDRMRDFGSSGTNATGSGSASGAEPGAPDWMTVGPEVYGESLVGLSSDADLGDTDSMAPSDFDVQPWVKRNRLTYANHPAVSNPMTDSRLDDVLLEGSYRMGRADYGNDVGCCANVAREGTAQVFGSIGDGRDVLNTSGESGTIIGSSVARVKVIRAISWCGGPGAGIIGCAFTPGRGMALVRLSSVGNEALLWVHEYGHNTGLFHVSSTQRIMYGSLLGNNNGLNQSECNRFHTPNSAAQALQFTVGACEDSDGDSINDILDNCDDVASLNQTDTDGDGVGQVCDNCPSTQNPDQANNDGDSQGDLCDDDDDNDGVHDLADCAPFQSFASVVAGEPTDVRWDDQTTLAWTRGVEATTTHVYRGGLETGFLGDLECLASLPALFSTSFATTDPEVGEAYNYLLTSENICGISPAGADSDGVPRTPDPCP